MPTTLKVTMRHWFVDFTLQSETWNRNAQWRSKSNSELTFIIIIENGYTFWNWKHTHSYQQICVLLFENFKFLNFKGPFSCHKVLYATVWILFQIEIPNWNSKLKFQIEIPNWNSKLKFQIEIRKWNSELKFQI